MGDNAKSGHTTGLTDGDYILSPSFTNAYEGLHGNGILALEDGATGDGDRNTPASMPGAVSSPSSNNVLNVKGGYAVIDGMIVPFGGGYDSNTPDDFTVTLEDSRIEGNQSALTTEGQSVLLVVYICSDSGTKKNIYVEMGTPVASGSYPVTPEGFLTNPNNSLDSKQTTVLAVVKCVYSNGSGDLNMTTGTAHGVSGEILDRRTFLRPSPIYMTPMSTGAVGATPTDANRIDDHADLDGMYGSGGENGDLTNSDLGALWMSHSGDGDHVMYLSAKQGGARRTHRLGPDKLKVTTTAETVKFDGPNFYHATPTGAITYTPSGTFPPGHIVTVNNTSSHTITWENGVTDLEIGGSAAGVFAYTGATWVRIFASSSVSSSPGGASGDVQYNDGSSGFTAEAAFTYNAGTNTLTVGVLSTAGLISAPTGVQFAADLSSNPGTDHALWYKESDDRLYLNTTKVLLDGDSVGSDLNALSAAVVNVAADSIAFIDADDNSSKKESIADLATAMGGTGLSGSGGTLNVDATQAGITSIGPAAGTLTVAGNLTVNGATVNLSSSTITVDDKNIELASVATGNFTATTVNTDATLSSVSSIAGLVVGMTVTGTNIPGGTTIIGIGTTTVEMSANATDNASGVTVTFGGATDVTADGGGITLKAAADRSILWNNANDAWTFNQHIYPSADSTYNLGSNTIRFATGYLDALTTGTITGSGDVTIDTNVLKVDTANDRVGVGQAAPDATFQVKEAGFGYGSGTLSAENNDAATVVNDGTSTTGIFLFDSQKFRGGKLLVEVANEGNDPDFTTGRIYETAEMVITHNGRPLQQATEAYLTTYGVVTSGGGTLQGSYNASIVSGNVELQVTPTVDDNDITVRVSWQAMTI